MVSGFKSFDWHGVTFQRRGCAVVRWWFSGPTRFNKILSLWRQLEVNRVDCSDVFTVFYLSKKCNCETRPLQTSDSKGWMIFCYLEIKSIPRRLESVPKLKISRIHHLLTVLRERSEKGGARISGKMKRSIITLPLNSSCRTVVIYNHSLVDFVLLEIQMAKCLSNHRWERSRDPCLLSSQTITEYAPVCSQEVGSGRCYPEADRPCRQRSGRLCRC